jgi:hypothetical protein
MFAYVSPYGKLAFMSVLGRIALVALLGRTALNPLLGKVALNPLLGRTALKDVVSTSKFCTITRKDTVRVLDPDALIRIRIILVDLVRTGVLS